MKPDLESLLINAPAGSIKMNGPDIPDEERLYQLNIYHRTNDAFSLHQLQSLYGRVNEDQDRTIIGYIYGRSVLDVGAGYGTLAKRLQDSGFETCPIEPNSNMREKAWDWYGLEELPISIYETPFDENSFDTVILRECVEHLDMPRVMREIRRICRRRVLIFQTNLNPYIASIRMVLGHKEYNPQDLQYYSRCLKEFGFSKQTTLYRDIFAFPLSGGYISRQLVPHHPGIEGTVLELDNILTRFTDRMGLTRYLSWRFLLQADRSSLD
jgi:SAM-dependent methyltransferase